jgi:hypothetical protein
VRHVCDLLDEVVERGVVEDEHPGTEQHADLHVVHIIGDRGLDDLFPALVAFVGRVEELQHGFSNKGGGGLWQGL